MTLTEAQQSVLDGDRAFDAFFADRYGPMVGLAVGMVDERATAEEIVQDGFQRVWSRWGSLAEPACYLRTAVINSCHDELRKRRVRREAHRAIGRRSQAEPHYLIDVLAGVPPRRREALVRRYYGGHTVSEIAEAMEIPTGTAKSLIHRGLADVRGALD